MRRQLEVRNDLLDDSARRWGWKLAMTSEQGMAWVGMPGPLIGSLTSLTILDGSAVSPQGMENPQVEPEIAVLLGSDISPHASKSDVLSAVAGLSAALEVVDIDAELVSDTESLVASNIFHRFVLLREPAPPSNASLLADASVTIQGATARADVDVLMGLLQYAAEYLAAFDEGLRAGDWVMTGSMTTPVVLQGGVASEFDFGPLGVMLPHVS